jgi:type IV pilus assembly protein PilQ
VTHRMHSLGLCVAIALVLVAAPAGRQNPEPAVPAPTAAVVSLDQFDTSAIDVDYQSANLRTVLRQLAEIGGANLVIDSSVPTSATIDLRLRQVPWPRVMALILRTGRLAHEVEGNVVRVLTLEAQASERRARNEAALEEAKGVLADLPMRRFRLAYADAADVAALLKELRYAEASRGAVHFEARTNTLIVQASSNDLDEIAALVGDLDRPEPQVTIEARVVQTLDMTMRDIGVRWGFAGRADPAVGNTGPLAFPNTARIDGRSRASGGTVEQFDETNSQGSIVGLALGAIDDAFDLDVALRALETDGALQVISTPRITTQNNMEAEVTQGVEIPYQVVTTTGGVTSTSIQFKDAALKLLVTPTITPADTVILDIALENGTPSDVLGSESAGPSIRTDRARTRVQVADGATTVIGGILATSEQNDATRTPGLSRVPILGWLFRNEVTTRRAQELVIFITPRIIRG